MQKIFFLGLRPKSDSQNVRRNSSQNLGSWEASSSWTPSNYSILTKMGWLWEC